MSLEEHRRPGIVLEPLFDQPALPDLSTATHRDQPAASRLARLLELGLEGAQLVPSPDKSTHFPASSSSTLMPCESHQVRVYTDEGRIGSTRRRANRRPGVFARV
jgi:hypothetical protein